MYKANFSGETCTVYFETAKVLPIETYPLYGMCLLIVIQR